MKKLVLNKNGMIAFNIILTIAIFLGAIDTSNIATFITTKAIALLLITLLIKGINFIPTKYKGDE